MAGNTRRDVNGTYRWVKGSGMGGGHWVRIKDAGGNPVGKTKGGQGSDADRQGKPGRQKWAFYVGVPKTHRVNGVVRVIKGTKTDRWVKVGSDAAKLYTARNVHPVAHQHNRTGKPPVNTPYPKNPKGYEPTRHPGPKGDGGVRGTKHPPKTYTPGPGGPGPKSKKTKNTKDNSSANYTKILKSIGKGNVGTMQKLSSADAMAGLQYDAQIHDLKQQMANGTLQGAQNQRDITDWYNQVSDLNNQAGTRNGQVSDSIASAQDAATQRILASIGGAANGSSGAVAAEALNSSGLQRQLGGIDQQYHNDMSPLLAAQSAGAKQAQINLQLQAQAALGSQLTDAQGQRGQAVVQNQQAIIAANNALAQQRFGNSISSQQAAAGIAELLGNVKLNSLKIQQGQEDLGGGNHSWNSYDPSDRDTIIKQAVAMNDKGHATRSMAQALKAIQGAGFSADNPSIKNMLSVYYKPASNGLWNIR